MNFDQQAAQVLAQLARGAAWFDLEQTTHRRASARVLKQLFFNLVRVLQPDVFLEAGAMDASVSLRVRKMVRKAQVVAFEANPHNHATFSAAQDFKAARVEYRHCALSDQPGEVTFNVLVAENGRTRAPVSGRSSLLRREEVRGAEYEPVQVPARTLDLEAAALPGRVALWVDVEGAAGAVLTGAAQTLQRCDLLLIEVETHPFWQGQWLHLDVCRHLLAAGLVPVARDFEFPHQFNLLFLSPAALARAEVMQTLEKAHAWIGQQSAVGWPA
jgi:FkbM family methyltransferase